MRPVHHSVRLPVAFDKALRALAVRQGISVYAMLQRSVIAGITAQTNPPEHDAGNREMIAELVSVSTRMTDVERLIDRTLYTACAAYSYARCAALGARKSDEIIAAEIKAAYDRQRRLSQESQS